MGSEKVTKKGILPGWQGSQCNALESFLSNARTEFVLGKRWGWEHAFFPFPTGLLFTLKPEQLY